MLFKPEHVDLILEGKKTATRRVWKKQMVKVGRVYKAKTKMLSKLYFARIRVLKVYKQKLKQMTDEDCRKEGYDNFASFMRIWIEINGSWKPELEVDVIEFEVLNEDDELLEKIKEVIGKDKGSKFECLSCHKILNGQEEVREHKSKNWDHFEYHKIGSKLKLAFA